ncbi:SusC/RagA family TonB-linked outer membrane protein [Parapedobacter pyrenivorans]|uniref:SusC/RagA family TonB-linked outer membrane protein n=1 Tax=Parapedobacter pyrenivorans TaxID=1305674 RepID=UPI003341B88B
MMKRIRLLLYGMLAAMLFIQAAYAQTKTITGKVLSSTDSLGITGVTVRVKDRNQQTVTDNKGDFSITANVGETLVFSSIGFGAKEIVINNETTQLNIFLDASSDRLDEVVVIGYGEQRRRDLTGAIASVSAEQFENERPQNIADILRNNTPGLAVGVSSSAQGGGSFEIRGNNSLRTSTDPLIVLDGVIYVGNLSDINPNDVESIDVMKDASSAAIYGARSANGVIQITTKRGKDSGKPIISFNSSIGVAHPTGYGKVYGADEFVNWRSDLMKSLNYYNPATKDKLYLYDDPNHLPSGVTLDEWRGGLAGEPLDIWLSRLGLRPLEIENYKAGKSIDWADMIYQQALRQDHNVSLSGRANALTYFVSLGYNNNEGVVVGDQFKTIRNRINIDADVTSWLKVGINSQFARRDESNVNAGTNIQVISPWGSMYEDDGTSLRLSPVDDLVAARNPLYDRAFTDRLLDITTITSTLFAQVQLPFGISYQANYTPHFNMRRYFNHQSSEHQEWGLFGGQVDREHTENFTWQLDNLIKWNHRFNNHQLDATVLINAEKVQGWGDNLSVQEFAPSDVLGYHNVGAGGSDTRNMGSDDIYSTRDALMGRLNYAFKDRYMATVALRRDGFSAFGMRNPRAYFPTVALGWVISDERFLQSNILTYGKLRLSWGENGNSAIGIYDALSPIGISQYPYYSLETGNPYEVNRMFVERMANHELKWERTQQLNLGFDFSIKEGLLDGSIDLYRSTTLDLLVDRSLPLINSYASVTDNLGKIENRGIEFTLNAAILKRENFSWNSGFNFTVNRNKIVSLYGNMEDVLDDEGNVTGQRESDDIPNRWFIGKAIDVIWAPKVLGVWQLGDEEQAAEYGQYPGDFKLKDVDGNGVINQADYEFQGNREPQFRWNLRQEFVFFKNLEFAFNMYAQLGYKATFNRAKNSDGFPERQNAFATEYWTPENPTNRYSRLYALTGGVPFDIYRNKSFVRLDRISLAYRIPQRYLDAVNLKSLKLFFNIQNVGFWAPDWEQTDPQAEGLYPRNYTFGVNLSL